MASTCTKVGITRVGCDRYVSEHVLIVFGGGERWDRLSSLSAICCIVTKLEKGIIPGILSVEEVCRAVN